MLYSALLSSIFPTCLLHLGIVPWLTNLNGGGSPKWKLTHHSPQESEFLLLAPPSSRCKCALSMLGRGTAIISNLKCVCVLMSILGGGGMGGPSWDYKKRCCRFLNRSSK